MSSSAWAITRHLLVIRRTFPDWSLPVRLMKLVAKCVCGNAASEFSESLPEAPRLNMSLSLKIIWQRFPQIWDGWKRRPCRKLSLPLTTHYSRGQDWVPAKQCWCTRQAPELVWLRFKWRAPPAQELLELLVPPTNLSALSNMD